MLTITDIKNINFRKANLGGYRPEDVEEFIDQVTVSYDQILKDNAELTKQVETLNKKIETYRADEDNIRAALMNAQKLGEASIRESKHKSDIILKDAAVKSERIVTNAQREVAREEELLASMRRQIAAFKTRLMLIYKEHMNLIEALPDDDVEESSLREQRPVERTTRISDVMDTPEPIMDLFPDDEDDDFDSDVLKSFSVPKVSVQDDADDDAPAEKRGEEASNIEEVINPFNSFLSGQKFPVSPVSFGQEEPKKNPTKPPRNDRAATEGKDARPDKRRRPDARTEEHPDKRQDKRSGKQEPAPENPRRRDRGGRRGMAVDMADREDNTMNAAPQQRGKAPLDMPQGPPQPKAPQPKMPRDGAPSPAQNEADSRFGTLKFGADYEGEDDKDDMPMGMFRRRR